MKLSMDREENRIKRRDRKRAKRKHGMRVDTSARKLAEIIVRKLMKGES